MKKFTDFLVEGTMPSSIDVLAHEVQQALASKEIVKPRYDQLKSGINRIIRNEFEETVTKAYRRGRASDFDDHPEDAMRSLFWETIDSTNGVLSLKNKLAKVKDKQNDVYKAFELFYHTYQPLAQQMKDLQQYVVKTTVKRAEAKAAQQVVMQKKFTDSSSLISILQSHKQEYIEGAAKRADEFVQHLMDVLAKAGWNLNAVAPEPDYKMSRTAYNSAASRRQTYNRLVTQPDHGQPSYLRRSVAKDEPLIVKPNEAGRKHYIEASKAEAAARYDAFIQKMIEKIGKPVENAKLTGSIWTGCQIWVRCVDGEEQIWNTKMIINFSKYQLMFNQFPSRRAK